MFRHCGAIALRADVDPNKLKSFEEDMQLFHTQGQILGLTDLELAFHVYQGDAE